MWGISPPFVNGQIPRDGAVLLGDNSQMAKTPTDLTGNHAAFHTRLREKLDQHGLSARQVSLAVTGAPTFVRDLLARNHVPRSDNLQTLAAYLGVTAEWLLYGTDRPTADQAGQAMVDNRVTRLSP